MQTDILVCVRLAQFLKYAIPTQDELMLLVRNGHGTHSKYLELTENARENLAHIIVISHHPSP